MGKIYPKHSHSNAIFASDRISVSFPFQMQNTLSRTLDADLSHNRTISRVFASTISALFVHMQHTSVSTLAIANERQRYQHFGRFVCQNNFCLLPQFVNLIVKLFSFHNFLKVNYLFRQIIKMKMYHHSTGFFRGFLYRWFVVWQRNVYTTCWNGMQWVQIAGIAAGHLQIVLRNFSYQIVANMYYAPSNNKIPPKPIIEMSKCCEMGIWKNSIGCRWRINRSDNTEQKNKNSGSKTNAATQPYIVVHVTALMHIMQEPHMCECVWARTSCMQPSTSRDSHRDSTRCNATLWNCRL